MKSIEDLQERIGYRFSDRSLLEHAMVHRSYANETEMPPLSDNERLEFLGDAVLEIAVSDYLYKERPQLPEGELSKLRASLVCEPTLAVCAKEIGLGEFVRLSHGEDSSGGRGRKSILSDAFEAVIGAIYLDGGMEPATKFIMERLLSDIEHKQLFFDSKTKLQELVQGAHDGQISYRLLKEEGPDHAKQFTVEVCVDERRIGVGTGHSKKAAEQEAAYQGLLVYRQKG